MGELGDLLERTVREWEQKEVVIDNRGRIDSRSKARRLGARVCTPDLKVDRIILYRRQSKEEKRGTSHSDIVLHG